MTTFQEHFARNLAGFGWALDPDEIPDEDSVNTQLHWISDWWAGLDETTKDILRSVDLSDGLWAAGKLKHWPGYHQLMSGVPFSRFTDTNNNIIACFVRARNAVDEQPEPMSDVNRIVGDAEATPAR